MILSEEKSKAELSTFIESYWCFEGNGVDDLVFFPDGTFNIFYAPDEFVLKNEHTLFKSGVYMVPISSVPTRISTKQRIYGIRFKAFSLLNVFNKDIRPNMLLTNLEAFTPKNFSLKHITGMFDPEQNISEITSELEKIAFELLRKKFNVNVHLRDKVNYILDNKGQIKIEEMAQEFGLSRQALHKDFKKNLLVTPKELSAIWQLNHFFTLSDKTDDSLTGVALDAGYYDQAHFINSFKMKFGMSPSKFLTSNPHVFKFAKESMLKRFNNYYDPEN